MKFANMHLHSTYSDAGFTPEQLVLIGKSLGYKALILTDHETDGGCKSFLRHAARNEIETFYGAEFYAKIDGRPIHLTALDYDPEDAGIRAFIEERCRLQAEWVKLCVETGLERGYIEGITWDDVVYYGGENAWLCTDSLFLALRLKKAIPEQGLTFVRQMVMRDPELKLKKAPHPTAEEVIRIVRKAGGVIALAHPSEGFQEYIGKLVDLGLNGIETDHPEVAVERLPLIAEAAETYKLYHCGGTDHTGPMSCCGGRRAIPVFNGITAEEFYTLKERKLG